MLDNLKIEVKKLKKRYGVVGVGLIIGMILMVGFLVFLLSTSTGLAHAEEDENTFMDQIVAGDWWGAVSSVYVNVIGGAFWVIMIILPCTMLYIKTRSSGPPTLLLIVGSAIFGFLFPMLMRVLFVTFIGLGIGLILYRAFTKGGAT